MSAIELVIDLPFLAGEVNDAHRQVTFHAKGMLLEAKRAGDALLAAKAKVRHGEFTTWIESNCRCSVTSAREYMQVAKHAKRTDLRCFDGGVRAFLEAHAKGTESGSANATPGVPFDRDDAEWVLKINDRAERGEGAERIVAASKLETVAARYGTTPDALLERSRAMCPDREKAPAQAARDSAMDAAEARIRDLETRLEKLVTRRAEIIAEYVNLPKADILEALADALITLETIN